MIVPNDNYVFFEKCVEDIIKEMYHRKHKDNYVYSCSEVIMKCAALADESSVYYWCHKNNI